MRSHPADTVVTEALQHLDPAPETDLTEAEQARADAALARILATPLGEPLPAAGRPRRRWRLVLVAGLAGAVGVGVPGLLLGGNAYGSWTPRPEPLSSATAAAAAATCRAQLGIPDHGERVEVAERRGDWTYVLLADTGTESTCLMPDDAVGRAKPSRGDFFGSHDPDAPAAPTLAPDGFEEATSMQGRTDEGWFLWVAGYVGNDVTGVTVHPSSGPDVEASVVGNRFAAWWPGRAQSSTQPAATWTYTLHLADGRTRDVS